MTAILLDQTRVQSRLFMTTARLLGASFIQRIYLELHLVRPTIRRLIVFGSILIIGDVAISGQLAPIGSPLVMPYTLQLIGSYRFPIGSLALLIILLTICCLFSIFRLRNKTIGF